AVLSDNMVSHHYFSEHSSPQLVPGIIRTRLHEPDPDTGVDVRPKFLTLREQESFYSRNLQKKPLRYLLCVATIEPRKNHARLLAAWEVIKAETDPDLKLVVVGSLGWNYLKTVQGFRPWIDRGELFMLSAVPAPDLRVLYRHAVATVCPSIGEGFDFSGVESMRSGGVVIASGIAAHREVYADGAAYFDPYSTVDLVAVLKKVLYADNAARVQQALRHRADEVSARYLPAQVLPQWDVFLADVVAKRKTAIPRPVAATARLPTQTADAAEESCSGNFRRSRNLGLPILSGEGRCDRGARQDGVQHVCRAEGLQQVDPNMRDNLLFALVARLWAAELVTAAYVGILGRPPDEAGLRAHCADLGWPRSKSARNLAEMLAAMSRSPERWKRSLEQRADELVRGAFKAILHREPLDEELRSLAAQLGKSGDLFALIAHVAGSQEHWEQLLEARSEELVLALYRLVFGRDPGSAVLKSYASRLKGGDLSCLLADIWASEEFWQHQVAHRAGDLVRAAYRSLLRREPEDAALTAYAEQLKEHKSLEQLLGAIGQSQELASVVQCEGAEELVRTVFASLLNREPEEAALKAY